MRRWLVHARAEFDAAHALTSYGGRPEASHRHRWAVAVRVATDALNSEGYAVDFHALRELLDGVTAPLDGSDLNHHPDIGSPSPTAERVAEVLASQIEPEVARLGARLLSITVWEGPENRVDLEL
jgi:6-pyruvoyl-tetrahydropterin synthase